MVCFLYHQDNIIAFAINLIFNPLLTVDEIGFSGLTYLRSRFIIQQLNFEL